MSQWASGSSFDHAKRLRQHGELTTCRFKTKKCYFCNTWIEKGNQYYSYAPGGARRNGHKDCVDEIINSAEELRDNLKKVGHLDYLDPLYVTEKFKFPAKSKDEYSTGGDKYSQAALQQLAEKSIGVPVTKGIDGPVIGKVVSAKVDEDNLKFNTYLPCEPDFSFVHRPVVREDCVYCTAGVPVKPIPEMVPVIKDGKEMVWLELTPKLKAQLADLSKPKSLWKRSLEWLQKRFTF